jgi:hypothetical protein
MTTERNEAARNEAEMAAFCDDIQKLIKRTGKLNTWCVRRELIDKLAEAYNLAAVAYGFAAHRLLHPPTSEASE